MNWNIFFSSVLIGTRESLEALVFIIIVYGIAKRANVARIKLHLFFSSLIGVALAFVIGLLISLSSSLEFFQDNRKLVNLIIIMVVAILLTYFVLWMILINPNSEIEKIKKRMSSGRVTLAIYTIIIGTTFKEGLELVLFSTEDLLSSEYSSAIGIFVGIFLAIILSIAFSLTSKKLPFSTLLTILSWFLIIQTGYIYSSLIRNIQQYYNLEIFSAQLWNVDIPILKHDKGVIGVILNILVGWRSKITVAAFIVQLTVTISLTSILLFRRFKLRKLSNYKNEIQSRKLQ